jgi:hypothetical protein
MVPKEVTNGPKMFSRFRVCLLLKIRFGHPDLGTPIWGPRFGDPDLGTPIWEGFHSRRSPFHVLTVPITFFSQMVPNGPKRSQNGPKKVTNGPKMS